MSAPLLPLQSRLENLIALSRLFERVEASGSSVGADAYRSLVGKLKEALREPLPAPALEAILSAHPATAEIYENLNYEASGLSRAPLDRSVSTEMLAAQAIERARRGPVAT